MAIDAVVKALVENFRGQSGAYLSPSYNETQLRRDFLDKVLKALGWDMNNTRGTEA
jgi:predicted type IV restriction endonuclease